MSKLPTAITAILCVASAACTSPSPGGGEPTDPADQQAAVRDGLAGSPSSSGTEVAASTADQPTPYIAINQVQRPLLPQSNRTGMLEVVEGCVTFVAAGERYLPVFPSTTRLTASDGGWTLNYHDRVLRVGDQVTLGGGPFDLRDRANVRLDPVPPSSCPSNIFAAG